MSETTKKGNAGQGWLRRNAVRVVIGLIAIVALIIVTKIPARNRVVPPGEVPPVNVKVMTVTAEPELVDTFDLPAVVEPNRIVNISAEVAGRIEQIPLKKGNPVRAGDILVRLNQDLVLPSSLAQSMDPMAVYGTKTELCEQLQKLFAYLIPVEDSWLHGIRGDQLADIGVWPIMNTVCEKVLSPLR